MFTVMIAGTVPARVTLFVCSFRCGLIKHALDAFYVVSQTSSVERMCVFCIHTLASLVQRAGLAGNGNGNHSLRREG